MLILKLDLGTLYELRINDKQVGLWNFVSSRGCRETFTGVKDEVSDENCYHFHLGNGYAAQGGIRNYDSRYLSVSLEFKSFDFNALLIMMVNEQNV